MSEDSYTQVSEQSWFSRIGDAFKGIIFGLILFLIAFVLLFWNEGRAVKTYKTLKEGKGSVISVPIDKVDPANQGKLVHVNGKAVTEETLSDPIFGVSGNVIKLSRKVEMYQWQEHTKSETKKKLGGGKETTTTYSYKKGWIGHEVSSSSFKRPSGHQNPGLIPYQNLELLANKVSLGAFTLPTSLIRKIGGVQQLFINSKITVPNELAGHAQEHDGSLYLGNNPILPQVGDVRIKFEIIPQQEISVVAQQSGNNLTPYRTKTGGYIELLQAGIKTPAAMFEKAQSDNKVLTWVLRAVGFLLMFAGLSLMLKVLSVLADVIPFFGYIVGAGTGIISFLIAGVLSLITIAMGWITFRPLLGIGLIAGAVVLGALAKAKMRRAKPKTVSQSS